MDFMSRTQLLRGVTVMILESDMLEQLNENNFVENCLEILIDFCNAKEYTQSFQSNVSVSLLEQKSELEVRAQKGGDVSVSVLHKTGEPPPPTAELVKSLSDALHNINTFGNCPIQHWNDQGLYRLLFRCCSWSGDRVKETHQVRAATCRAILTVTSHKCVRQALASTKDCLHNLLTTLTAFNEDEIDADCMESRAQGLYLLASLLGERTAIESVWRELRDIPAVEFFHWLLQCLQSDENELEDAALYCLTQIAQSITNKKHVDKSQDKSCSEFYDNLKSPFWDGVQSERVGAGDSARDNCQPEYISEELCKALIDMYQKLSMENTKHQPSQDERWTRVCSCLSSVLSVSARSRHYAVHRQLPLALLSTLQAVRDHLSIQGKPADVIRNANHNPVLRTLYWLLTVIDCSMVECLSAKESFADENIAISLCRLWSWCMMTEQLRHAVVHLLYTFTNGCPQACAGLCACVGGRTLASELCALVAREASLQAHVRASAPLLHALHTLRRVAHHHHCRAIILKSEAMVSMFRLCVRARVRGAGAAGAAWARVCESAARHSDGSAALLAARAGSASLATLPPATRTLLLPAIAHAAHHHRQTFLQSPDLLELLCDTLLAGDTAEIVSATRAIWALAANNHKAKLVLRSAGAASAVQTTLQRLQRLNRDGDTQRAVQLLMYTNTVLQTP